MNEHESYLVRIVEDALHFISPDEKLAIAYSGGLDSHVLLDAVVGLRGHESCLALHIHHGLSPFADKWQLHVQQICQAYQVPCLTRRISLKKSKGLEADARQARYQALFEMCHQAQIKYLLLAHHADDQVETVLLQLMRGAGLPGLAAMPQCLAKNDQEIMRVRPLLRLTHQNCLEYAQSRQLKWIEDESNLDKRFKRNAIRHTVLPALIKYFPEMQHQVLRSTEHIAQAQLLLDELAQIDLQTVAHDRKMLSLSAFLKLSKARSINLLRYWMKYLGLPAMSNTLLHESLRQLIDIHSDQHLMIEHAGYNLCVYRDNIYWVKRAQTLDSRFAKLDSHSFNWNGQREWCLDGIGRFTFEVVKKEDSQSIPKATLETYPLSIRLRSGRERFQDHLKRPSHSLKNIFQERAVPQFLRKMPLLYLGDTLLFVPFVGLNLKSKQLFNDQQIEEWVRIDWQSEERILSLNN